MSPRMEGTGEGAPHPSPGQKQCFGGGVSWNPPTCWCPMGSNGAQGQLGAPREASLP